VLLTEHYAMKVYIGGVLHTFLSLALDRGEWSASRPGSFNPRERAPGTHWIGGWVGPRAGLNAVVKWKISSPAEAQTLDHPAHSTALYRW